MSTLKSAVTRRGFVAGAGAVTAGVAAIGSTAIALADQGADATKTAEQAGSANATRSWGASYPWAAEPTPISDADVEEVIDADVAVVGLGIAGVSAFRAASEQGATVVAVEKAAEPSVRSS